MEDESLSARFEHIIMLQELLEEFLMWYDTKDAINQPTLLDFAEWVPIRTREMADQLGLELDGDETQAE